MADATCRWPIAIACEGVDAVAMADINPTIVRLEPQTTIAVRGEVMHIGPFEAMEKTYAALQAWMDDHQIQPAAGMWEVYMSDSQTEPDHSKWKTKIVWPIA